MESAPAVPLALTPQPQIARVERLRPKLQRAQLIDRIGHHVIAGAGILVLLSVGTILVFLVVEALPLILNPAKHAGGTLDKLLVPQLYDGYGTAQYVWQTETAEGGQEKFGVPLLILGTIKGALCAMVISVPLALLAALYVAEFASGRQRTVIKSTIELLAGIPTVVVGFVAFVTLSTAINAYYTTHQPYFDNGQWIVFPIQLAVLAVVGSAIGGNVSLRRWPRWQKFAGYAGAVLAGFVFALLLGRGLESVLGTSLTSIFGVTKFTQLNGLLAGVCLGFAIIPVIFSVAEDAMRAVPQSQREASLALGGSKWETALRVVVPAAFPGIYAAVTLGMARAIGETMIVLMASGNTALPDWSPFTGMRTMAAAIAIEAPEKALGSTGYYVLFFVGALLFLLCFLLNVAADQVIYRLKRRYRLN